MEPFIFSLRAEIKTISMLLKVYHKQKGEEKVLGRYFLIWSVLVLKGGAGCPVGLIDISTRRSVGYDFRE